MNEPVRLRWLLIAWLMGLSQLANAQVAVAEHDEHRHIVAARVAADERYVAEERACRQRFVVSSCIEDAKRTRRAALVPLRERQIALDTARRQRSAAARRESIARKPADDSQRGGVSMPSRDAREAAASSPSDGAPAAVAAPGNPRPAKVPSVAVPNSPRPFEARIRNESANRAAFAARRRDAELHRQEVAARNAAREREGKSSKALRAAPESAAPHASAPAAASTATR